MTVLEHLENQVRGFAIEVASQVSPEVRILGVDGIPGGPAPFFQIRCLDATRSEYVEGAVGLAQCD